jgi:hypothetical protein
MRNKTFRFAVTALVGSTLPNIFNKCRNHSIEPKYYGRFVFTLVVSGILEILNLWERLAWRRKVRKTPPGKPPVFIIGFWRSGTTLLHNLLCSDEDAAYTTTFQNVFPNITLSQSWWLRPVTNLVLPEERPFDNVHMDMNNPQEEEFALVNLLPSSFYNLFIFPEDFEKIIEKELLPETLTTEELERWKECYRGMTKKAMLNTGGTRFVSKNPINMVRMKLLKEMYPDAKFIFIYRNPYQVVESFYRFFLSIFPGIQLQSVPASFNRERMVQFYTFMMDIYFADRAAIPPEDLIEIRMEEFMEEIYSKFNLGPFEKARENCAKHLQERGGNNHHAYEIPDETYLLVDRYASGIIERLGYEPATHSAGAEKPGSGG